MASSKHQILSIYGTFYLPLAVLSGLTLSLFLPSALSFLIPAMDSALFISLPQLWNASLSWVTLPWLFVLLNGIIVVLTASSGMLSSSESDSGSDFYTNLLVRMENSQKASSGGLMPASPASDWCANRHLKMMGEQKQPCAATMVGTHHIASSQAEFGAPSDAGSLDAHIPQSSCRAMLRARTPCVFYDADGVPEAEPKKSFDNEDDDDDGDDDAVSNLSRLAAGISRSLSHVRMNTRIWDDNGNNDNDEEEEQEEEEEEEEEEKNERISGLPKLAMVSKSFSFGCRSEPSSPQFAMSSKSAVITRSLSVDSACFHDDPASSRSPEDLSDEAFRKRVEDFISKMNAQLRSEAK